MNYIEYGTKTFPEKIDITDPCYDKTVWCRMNDFEISPGKYNCYVTELDDEETGNWGDRVSRIGIRKAKGDIYRRVGSIGVDAGLAGFFINKPDYTDKEWSKFCGRCGSDRAWNIKEGFYSESGFGDGSYSVWAGYKNGKVVEVYIDFITDEDLYDEDEDIYEEPED